MSNEVKQKLRFQCRACMKEITEQEALEGKLVFGGAGFFGQCPKCKKFSLFFSLPEPEEVATQNEAFLQPVPTVCPNGHEGKVQRWGLSFICAECKKIFTLPLILEIKNRI